MVKQTDPCTATSSHTNFCLTLLYSLSTTKSGLRNPVGCAIFVPIYAAVRVFCDPDNRPALSTFLYDYNTSLCVKRYCVNVPYNMLFFLSEIEELSLPHQKMTSPTSGMEYWVRQPTNHWLSTTWSTPTYLVNSFVSYTTPFSYDFPLYLSLFYPYILWHTS